MPQRQKVGKRRGDGEGSNGFRLPDFITVGFDLRIISRRLDHQGIAMALDYETQIESLFPAALYQDPRLAPVLAKVGLLLEGAGNKILLFTDPRTVAALNAASEPIKAAVRRSGIGLVRYGGNRDGAKTEFLKGALRQIVQQHGSNADALRLAVFHLHKFVHDGTKALLDPNPFAGPVVPRPLEPFDLGQAVTAMAGQLDRPKSLDHLEPEPVGSAARPVFGKRLFGR